MEGVAIVQIWKKNIQEKKREQLLQRTEAFKWKVKLSWLWHSVALRWWTEGWQGVGRLQFGSGKLSHFYRCILLSMQSFTVASHNFKLWKIIVLSFAKCGVFCIFSLAPGMQMEDDWIRRHRHSCNTHPEPGYQGRMCPHFKALCQIQPLHDPSQQCWYNHREVWPMVPRIFFLRNQSIKCSTKRSVYGWGESLGRQRTSG